MKILRLLGAGIPFLLACYGAVTYASQEPLEERVAGLEIESARQDERYHAIVARIDAIDKTLWWLVAATLAGTGVSGAVATDRAVHRLKNSK